MTKCEILQKIVKANDIRGFVDSELTPELVRTLGAAFAQYWQGTQHQIVVGHDMRESSPSFALAFGEGVCSQGLDVLFLGLCSTDQSYFASGTYDCPAAMFTASHNPATYNGIKLSGERAQGLSLDTGLAEIRDKACFLLENGVQSIEVPGVLHKIDSLYQYATYLRSCADTQSIRKIRVVVDAGNGMGGLIVPAVLESSAGLEALDLELIPLYFELDGSFPNHEANPLDPKNLVDLQAAVVKHKADLGLAFDGDADRCFAVDEKGDLVSASAVGAIVALGEIKRYRKEHPDEEIIVLHNVVTSRIVAETITQAGATPVRTKVGHAFIKDQMKRTGAIFGVEHSAHYYFQIFWGADNGLLAALHLLVHLSRECKPLSEVVRVFSPYAASGEINSSVQDVQAVFERISDHFQERATYDDLDGLVFQSRDTDQEHFWWFSVRSSNTEPLVRLNVEAAKPEIMLQIRDEVLGLINPV